MAGPICSSAASPTRRSTPTGVHPPDRLLLGGPEGFRVDESFDVEPGRTAGAAFADLDGDLDLDLVLSRNVRD